jgi:hypothetical protein
VFSVTTTSFALARVVVGRGATEVVTGLVPVVEEKMMLMLLLIFLFFLRLYCNYNMNTRKEK